MVQAPRLAAYLPLSRAYRVDERPRLLSAERTERQPLNKALPTITRSLIADRLARHSTELISRTSTARRPEDPVVIRHEPRMLKVKQSRQELAARKVSQRTEKHDHVRIRNRRVDRVHHASMASPTPARARRIAAGTGQTVPRDPKPTDQIPHESRRATNLLECLVNS